MRDVEPVALGRPAREQIGVGRAMLAAAPRGSKLAGALPFDLSEPGALWVGFPEELHLTTHDREKESISAPLQLAGDDDDDFIRFVHAALKELNSGSLIKVVASRGFRVRNEAPLQPLKIFSSLSRDGAAAAFLCASDGRTLVGASPETLVRKQKLVVSSTPLAGSRDRAVGDIARAADVLLQSEKDLREHRLVVDDILFALRSAGASAVEAKPPFVLGTSRMWHLATKITGALHVGDARDSLDLVELLHPTPAVCGTPRDRAVEFIRAYENETRGLYSGAVGWQQQNGDGEWRVTLRCGVVDGDTAHIVSGAGLVLGSSIDEELSETKQKALTFLDALLQASGPSMRLASDGKEMQL